MPRLCAMLLAAVATAAAVAARLPRNAGDGVRPLLPMSAAEQKRVSFAEPFDALTAASSTRSTLFDCDDIGRRVRLVSSRVLGRGAQKEVYVGAVDGRNVVVLNMPWLNRVNHAHHSAVADAHAERALHISPEQAAAQFSRAVDKELEHIELPAVRDSRHIAHYLGGCRGAERGIEQVLVQEGPFLCIKPFASSIARALPWPARLRVVINVFALLLNLHDSHLIPCSISTGQLGVAPSLAVRLFDLGHLVDGRGDVHVGDNLRCSSHADCNPKAVHCVRKPADAHEVPADFFVEYQCNATRGHCVGVGRAAPLLEMVYLTFDSLLLHYDDVPARLRQRLVTLKRMMLQPTPERRPSPAQMVAWLEQAHAEFASTTDGAGAGASGRHAVDGVVSRYFAEFWSEFLHTPADVGVEAIVERLGWPRVPRRDDADGEQDFDDER